MCYVHYVENVNVCPLFFSLEGYNTMYEIIGSVAGSFLKICVRTRETHSDLTKKSFIYFFRPATFLQNKIPQFAANKHHFFPLIGQKKRVCGHTCHSLYENCQQEKKKIPKSRADSAQRPSMKKGDKFYSDIFLNPFFNTPSPP